MSKSKDMIRMTEKYGAHNYRPLPVVIGKAQGIWVWDVEGKKYLDMLSAYSAVNQGHRHPAIIKAMTRQAGRLTLTSRAFHNDQLGPFLRKLCQYSQMEAALPMNTGAEAVETAIKLARKWGYEKKKITRNQAEIIVCAENFHGRTTTIVSFSTDPDAYEGFGPAAPGFKIVPYNSPEEVEKAITLNTVAFMVEPIQGEAGVIVPNKGYLTKCKEICRRHNILFILDEVQTGFCRTGKPFCWQHENAKPDVMIVGKALGGGIYPVSAVLTRWNVMEVIKPGQHGSTFGGNPLACAIGSAALDVLKKEALDRKAREMGDYFRKQLRALKTNKIKEVRGIGLLTGMELRPEAGKARPYCERMMKLGMLAKDTHAQTIRFAPPLVITKKEVDWAVKLIAKALEMDVPVAKTETH
ncbi:ornithine--oxo-acid transaminase [candidate division TA06 bacterium]|uniref:ornithine aminotransferase n=1 Tax=candidate division TA06 bacterium TaxID=2250710 RepID=A0A933ID93_UNCT6|nr:ornithine--oxo-acid transaminase [candidate division TA06 bacterium]